ncbi:competence protein ComEA [Enterococcus sp. PF1-24]|uniref:helix-hairpin-helix domain-containing protein n=1 Tax=unclassified Enterococcus TaxID=2608891 RepID=UPI0024734A09|nr:MULTISPECIES: helix-hairpin-helix domain-containing protein [unclassified Enterococcus]MDH6364023.1 competence protein ComEA [Enterococcus sp. PFB1-1]MDH6401124.1 competence protein ComEA [Enterococcus sp. PF1-24]
MQTWQGIMKEKLLIILLAALGIVGAFCGYLLIHQPKQELIETVTVATTVESSTLNSSTTETTVDFIYVDIKGAVVNPGMYRLASECRLIDGIMAAGGFTSEADQNLLNFALKLSDQQVIYVAKVGEEVAAEVSNNQLTPSIAGSGEKDGKININTASAVELQTLSGIGEKKAQDIINYREANGSFKDISDLTKISGIGEKTLEKIKDSITI